MEKRTEEERPGPVKAMVDAALEYSRTPNGGSYFGLLNSKLAVMEFHDMLERMLGVKHG